MRTTNAERVAIKMLNLINSLHLDIEQVGRYIARTAPDRVFQDFHVLSNTAIIEREIVEGEQHDTLF